MSMDYIERMIVLTEKKSEALMYLIGLLSNRENPHDMAYNKNYFERKKKIEQAILKVDIEFLEVYQSLLEKEGVHSMDELGKGNAKGLKRLQGAVLKTRSLESEIESGEAHLFEKSEKHSKHTDQRATEVYKKFKK